MATLLPSLSSDDEPNVESDNDDDDDAMMADGFQFGGVLGEDGVAASGRMRLFDDDTHETTTTGWSYQTALDRLSSSTSNNNAPVVPRMEIDALIAAKRKAIQIQKEDRHQHPASSSSQKDKDDDHDHDSDSASSDAEPKPGKKNGSDDDDDGSSSNDDDDSDSDAEPLDDSHAGLAEDVLKTRAGTEQMQRSAKEQTKDSVDGEAPHDKGSDDSEDDSSSDDDDDNSSEDEDELEAAKAAAFFDTTAIDPSGPTIDVFSQLTLSRPLLRGVARMGFTKPTPIQASVIPLALQGRDICASAVTGSGKTAAFLLPVLERMLHRYAGRTKTLILTPTRELAAQCLGMMTTLAEFTKLTGVLIVGGTKNSNVQAAELRARPDLIVATPGRLLDHVTNTAGVTLEDVEFLILDEADRLLELGFQDEIMELVKSCPVQRQTLLFSATMNTKVDDLIQLSLKNPARVHVSDAKSGNGKSIEVAPRLEQEFVRIQAGNEGLNREAMLLALLTRSFTKQTIVFFDTKLAAHRLMILCGLCGIKCAELHGNLTQQQRLQALENFRKGDVDVLLATDLAARGLDINKVKSVINFEMPSNIETYVHRIGRTARAGRGGQSCTLIGEGRRHLMKELIKDAESTKRRTANRATNRAPKKGVIRSRSIPAAVIAHFGAKIRTLEPHYQEVLQAEVVARMDRVAEMEAIKAQNIIEHGDEISARPQREWFASNKQKKLTKEAHAERQAMIAEKAGTGVHRMTRKKRRAREVLEAMQEESDHEDSYEQREPKSTSISIKAEVRKQKRKEVERSKQLAGKSVRDHDMEEDKRAKKRKQKSSIVSVDDAGDGGLFGEEKGAHLSKEKQKQESLAVKSSYNFRGYNPEMKLGKKRGHKAFKSKSKHKRR